MPKTQISGPLQTSRNTKLMRLLAGLIAFMAVISFFLHARVQTSLFPKVRETRLRSLIQHTRAARMVDLKEFWQLRDEYGSGVFILSPDHTIYRETQELIAPTITAPRNQWLEFAKYTGKRVESRDFLVAGWPTGETPDFSPVLDRVSEANVSKERLVFQDEDTRLFLKDDNHLVVAFVAPLLDAASVYGLYDWTPEKLRQLDGYMLASVTSFTLDCCQERLDNFLEAYIDKPR